MFYQSDFVDQSVLLLILRSLEYKPIVTNSRKVYLLLQTVNQGRRYST